MKTMEINLEETLTQTKISHQCYRCQE